MISIEFIDVLLEFGWKKETSTKADKHPEISLPGDLADLCSRYRLLRNANDTAWFYSSSDYIGLGDSDFEWDFFKKNSLECALNEQQRKNIIDFWNAHIPFAASVANGYSYIALRKKDGSIVLGVEPEYEDSALVIAKSMGDFFDIFISSIKMNANNEIYQFAGLF